jgi:uncharacterized repeat protein (TIGR01451 family)
MTARQLPPPSLVAVIVRDTLQAAFVASSISSSQGGCAALPCSLGTLTPHATATVTVVGSIVGSYTGTTLVNTATVTSTTPDPDPSDNSATGTAIVTTSADLSIAKTASTPTPVAGESFGYTFTVTNAGPSDGTGVVITDPLPAGITPALLPPNCTIAAATISCSLGTIISGDSATITIEVALPASAAVNTVLTNTASVASNITDPNPGNNTGSVPVTVATNADVAVLKSASPSPATPGLPVTYTIEVTNAGPSDAQGVSVADPLAIGLTASSASSTAGSCSIGATVTCSLGTLASGGHETITIVANTDPAMLVAVSNAATATSATFDGTPANNVAGIVTSLAPRADVGITKTAITNPLVPGMPARYRIVVTNAGPATAQNVVVTDPLTVGLTAANAAATAGTCSVTPTVSCSLGDVPPGAAITILIDTTVASDVNAALTNTASVTTATPQPGGTAPDTASITTPSTPRADLTVSKLVDHGPLVAGEPVTYTITVTNYGPSDAHSVTLNDPIPAFLDPTNVVVGGDTACSGTTVVSCAWPVIAAYATKQFTIRATVLATATVAAQNTVTVSSPDDPYPSDNSAVALAGITTRADLEMVKTGPTTVTAGTTMHYQLSLTNHGPSSAANAEIRDYLPSGVTLISTDHAAACATSTATVVICLFGTMAPGVITVDALVSVDAANAAGPFSNTAKAASSTPDDQPSNNSDSHITDVVRQSAVAIHKTGPTAVIAGQSQSWTLTITNTGPSTAEAVNVSDPLPPGLEFATATFVTGSGACSAIGPLVGCSLGDLAPGATVSIALDLNVQPWVAGGTVLTNTATVSTITPDDPADNTSNVGSAVGREADLQIAKVVTPTSVVAGEAVTWTIGVFNAGPSDSTSAIIHDVIPSGFIVSGVTTSQGTCNLVGTALTCDPGVVPVGAQVIVSVIGLVDPNTTTDLTNNANVTPGEAEGANALPDSASATLTVSAAADLHLTKVGSPNPAVAGEAATWIITLTNNGPSVARNVEINDTIPAGYTVTSVDGSAGCTALSCSLAAVPVGATTVVVHGTISAATPDGPMVNEASVTSTTPDPNPGDESPAAAITVSTVADLGVTKSGTPAVAGGPISWVLSADNHGSSDASDVMLVDHLPISSIHDVTWSPASACSLVGGDLTCSLGTLAHRSATSITIDAMVNASFLASELDNSAVITSSTTDANPADNQTVVTVPVTQAADLRIAKSGVASVAGTGTTWTIVVTNFGPSDAQTVTVADVFPAGFSATSVTPSSACTIGVALTCSVATVAAGTATTITVSGDLAPDVVVGALENTATVTSATPDPTPDDHASTGTSDVSTSADLSVTKAASTTMVTAGDLLSWTITVANAGPSVARDVVLTDVVPAGFVVSSVAGSAGCTSLPCSLGSVAIGSTTVIVNGRVSASLAAGPMSNTATITSTTPDLDTTDRSATSTIPVVRRADLTITKTGPAVARWNTPADFEIVVTNNGPSTAEAATIDDPMPANLTALSATSDAGSCTVTARNVSCAAGTLAVGQVVRVTVHTLVSGTGTIQNVASVNSVSASPSAANTAIAGLQVSRVADLKLAKTIDREKARVGDVVTYTITVSNVGPDEADAVAAIDQLSAGLSFVDARPQSGTFNPETGQWTIGVLAVDATVTMELDARVTTKGLLTNTATVSSGVVEVDPDSNVAAATLLVDPKLPVTGSDIGRTLQLAAMAIALGSVLVAVGRRRRRPDPGVRPS